jgi:hypothetical protein
VKLYARAATAAGIALLALTGFLALATSADATPGSTPAAVADDTPGRLAVPRRCIQCAPPTTCTTTTTAAPTTTTVAPTTTTTEATTTTVAPPVTILVPITVPVAGRTEVLNAVDVTIERPETVSPVALAATAVVAEPRFTG